MRRNNTQNQLTQTQPIRGFTILETMIVLAVTTGLFIAIVAAFSGQQGKTEFTQGAREMESRVLDILNDVATGYYPSGGSYSCSASGAGPVFSTVSGTEQGKNGDCLFLGRVIQFDTKQYSVYSVAGQRLTASKKEVSTLAEAMPRAIAQTAAASGNPEATEIVDYPGGMTVKWIKYNNGANNTNAVGMFGTFGQQTASGSGLKSGSMTVNNYAIGSSAGPITKDQMVGLINNLPTNSTANPASGIEVCLDSASSKQHAILTIGGAGTRAATNLVINSGSNCP